MAKAFSPSTPLERAVHAGDYTAVVRLLRAMTPQERKELRAHAVPLVKLINRARYSYGDKTHAGWGSEPTFDQMRAAAAAVVVCGSTGEAAEEYYDGKDLIALLGEFKPPSLAGIADAMLAISPLRIRDVQRLIVAGLVPRPSSDEYALGLIALPNVIRTRENETLGSVIAADAGLQEVLLRIMEVEGTSEFSLSAIDKYAAKKGMSWSATLRTLCAQGAWSRATLLDKTLAALENDWPQFRSSWFSKFHDDLEPSVAEMTPHARRYLALCSSRIPPTVTMALAAVKELDTAGVLDSSELLEALRPVVSSSVKAQVDAALKMLDRLVKREPSYTAGAAALVAPALAHASADVQKGALKRLTDWGTDESLRETLRTFVPLVAAANRKELERLAAGGTAGSRSERPAPPPASAPPPKRISPLDPSRKLAPLDGIDELVERSAYVFENDRDIDEFERVIGAIVQAAPLSDGERARFGPLAQRMSKRAGAPIARELAHLLGFVLSGIRSTTQSTVDHGGHPALAQEFLIDRMNDLIEIAAQGKRQPPLSTPTHRRGFIDPALFVERVAAHEKQGVRSSRSEQVRALLRLAPSGIAPDTLARARKLADGPFTRALRYALGDDVVPGREVALFAAAARIRHPGADDTALAKRIGDLGPDAALAARYEWRVTSRSRESGGKTYVTHRFDLSTAAVPDGTPADMLAVLRHPPAAAKKRPRYDAWTFAGIDEGTILYSATLLPSSAEAFFAEGARVIGNNLDWWEAQWQNRAWLNLLLDPTVGMEPMATLLLALGLGGKEPGQTAIAVDALVHSYNEGRLDVSAFAGTLRDLLRTPLVKRARYAKSLASALRIDAGMASPLVDILCVALEADPEDPPKDTAMLLELLQEVVLTSGRALPGPARAGLEKLKLGGKGRAVRKRLLEG